jgi:hypothetical protein
MGGPKGAASFDCHWRIMESWVGTENVSLIDLSNEEITKNGPSSPKAGETEDEVIICCICKITFR